ncbi:Alg9-like mannosyltransferase family-domain-containing protein, partial [Piptocephalis cylindrospora]
MSTSQNKGNSEEKGPKKVSVEPRPLRAVSQPYCPNFSIAMRCLLVPRILAAILLPVADCDEVFNYWEPLHYATYGNGLETWEYTPEYGLRSWLYIFLH